MRNLDLPITIAQNDLLRLFDWHHLEAPVKQPRCEFVVAGSYSISRTTSGYLTTAPGAGVGLALYDKTAGVGGVAHFLLAEPLAGVGVRRSSYFASAVVPEFLQALLAAGARKEHLLAAVAGGSCLAGDLAKPDEIDLGTRVVDAVLAMLSQEQIPIASMEVGGLQPLSLLLDTGCWKASIQLVGATKDAPSAASSDGPSADAIEQAIAATKPIPQIALKIIRLLGSENNPSFAEIAEEIKRDQVFSAKIIRYSNSAFFAQTRTIDSVERAMLLLGEKNLFEVAVSTVAEVIYSGQEGGYSLMRGGLYRHALATAHVAKEIATFTGWGDPGTAYTAGLMHDIGKVVLDCFVAEALPFFYRQQDQVADIVELERQRFSTDHMVVGLRLASTWQLPDTLSQAIGFHHCPEKAVKAHRFLAHIVYLADLLASVYLSGVDMEQVGIGNLNQRMAVLGLQQNKLPLIIDSIPWKKLMYM